MNSRVFGDEFVTEFGESLNLVKLSVKISVTILVFHQIWWWFQWQLWCSSKFSEIFCKIFGELFSESPYLVMYLVTYFVTNFVSFSVRKYSHFSSPYLVMYLVIYFVTFLVKSHVLLYWRSIIGATKYRTYLYCLLMQFYGDFRFNLALVVSSLIINISCPLLSFGAGCPSLTLLNCQYLKNLFSQSSISW